MNIATDMIQDPAGAASSVRITAVELGDGGPVLVARANDFFICDDSQRPVGLALTEIDSSDVAVTRQLLAGCIIAPFLEESALKVSEAGWDLRDYVLHLCSTHQTTQATPSTMLRARDRFASLGDRAAAAEAEEKANQEYGHDRLAARDLEALGLPADELLERIKPLTGKTLVRIFHELANEDRPYGVFGYAYVLERLATLRQKDNIDAIQALVPAGVDITRCSRVHSGFGADAHHVEELVAFIAGLPKEQKDQICLATYRTAAVRAKYNNDADRVKLDALLDEWEWQPFADVRGTGPDRS